MKLGLYVMFIVVALLTSCSDSGFEGKFNAAEGLQEFTFKEDGYVAQSIAGAQVAEYKFEKNGKEIKVYINERTSQIFTLQDDGKLIGPMGVELTPMK